jgi:patatin-like phospholipase/acyl hydrolase
MTCCRLCGAEWPTRPRQLIRLKPKCAGVRILTLDGGGVRGIVELAILREIEDRVGLGVPIRDLFDLIVGTSTGEF